MGLVALLSVVAASVAFTIGEAAVFAGFRERLKGWNPWLGKLVGCGYCVGHWVAFGLVAVYRPRLFEAWWPFDYLFTALVIAWLAGFQWGAMCWLMDKARK